MIYQANRITPESRSVLSRPTDFLRCIDTLNPVDSERLYLFTLTKHHSLIQKHLLAIGLISNEIIKDIFRYVLYDKAAAFALVRSGSELSPKPTEQERDLVTDLQTVCDIMEIELSDYLLIGAQECYSFEENGELKDNDNDIPF